MKPVIDNKGDQIASDLYGIGSKKRDLVQVENPKTKRFVKIDRSAGNVISHKRSEGPYKDIPVAIPGQKSIKKPELLPTTQEDFNQ